MVSARSIGCQCKEEYGELYSKCKWLNNKILRKLNAHKDYKDCSLKYKYTVYELGTVEPYLLLVFENCDVRMESAKRLGWVLGECAMISNVELCKPVLLSEELVGYCLYLDYYD